MNRSVLTDKKSPLDSRRGSQLGPRALSSLFLALLFVGCSQHQQIPENQTDLMKTIKHDNFDDGHTPIVESIETPMYRLSESSDLICSLRSLRVTPRNPAQPFLNPVDYFVRCKFSNDNLFELSQAQDLAGNPLNIAYTRSHFYSNGKKNDTKQILQQDFLVTLNQEQLIDSVRQKRGYQVILKTKDLNQQAAYLKGITLKIPAPLLNHFYTYSALTWPEAKALLE